MHVALAGKTTHRIHLKKGEFDLENLKYDGFGTTHEIGYQRDCCRHRKDRSRVTFQL